MKTLSVLASSGSKLAYSAFVDGMRTSCPDASPWASSPSVVSNEAPLATTPSVQSVVELTPPVLSRSVLAPSALVNDVPTHSCCSKALGGGRGRGRGRGAIPSLQSTPATKPKMSGPSLSVGKELCNILDFIAKRGVFSCFSAPLRLLLVSPKDFPPSSMRSRQFLVDCPSPGFRPIVAGY